MCVICDFVSQAAKSYWGSPTPDVTLFLFSTQLDKMNSRVKALKQNVDEAEEEVARIDTKNRKLQRELDDLLERNDSLVREMRSVTLDNVKSVSIRCMIMRNTMRSVP